jgi:hypothetical protein
MGQKFERVALGELRQGRRGKHHQLIADVLAGLASLPNAEALKIPIAQAKGVSLANLRAAISRAASSRGLRIATYSDRENFYVWQRTKKSAPYERRVNRADGSRSNS